MPDIERATDGRFGHVAGQHLAKDVPHDHTAAAKHFEGLDDASRKALAAHYSGLLQLLKPKAGGGRSATPQPAAEAPPELAGRAKKMVEASRDPDAVPEHEARAFVTELAKLPGPQVYAVLKAAGVEGAKPTDSRKFMLQRFVLRVTATRRARSRAEV